jgi:WD40 repeat protein
VNTATFSPDSRILVIDKENHGLQLWNVKTQTEMHTLNTQDYYPPDWWAFSPDSQLLLSDYHDTDVALWSVETGAILHVFSKDFPSALVGFGPDNKTLYAMDDPANSDAKAQFHIWRLKDYQMMQEIPLRYKADFKKLRISRDVEYLALVSNHAVEVTSLKNGEILRRFC